MGNITLTSLKTTRFNNLQKKIYVEFKKDFKELRKF